MPFNFEFQDNKRAMREIDNQSPNMGKDVIESDSVGGRSPGTKCETSVQVVVIKGRALLVRGSYNLRE